MSELYFLPANEGDAFFLHCNKGDEEGWIVVDGGASKRLSKSAFLKEVEILSPIDLMVLTHHDFDHITGIQTYVNKHKQDKPFPVKALWVNCARHIDIGQGGKLSAQQAGGLADSLKEIQKESPITWMDYITDGADTSAIKFADIDVISPSADILKKYIPEYERRAGAEEPSEGLPLTAQHEKDDLDVSLPDLAKRPKEKLNENNYGVLVNMSSIAFVIKCDGLSALMLGDSFPKQIVDALTARGYSKENKLKVDFMKVSHHGSKFNINNELLDVIDCQNYLISTNGGEGKSYHPNREALANIICHPERNYEETIHMHFNYKLSSIASKNGYKLFNDGEEEEYNFKLHEPTDNTERCQYRATKF